MPRKKSTEAEDRMEEVRGIFVLGLLAVLSSVRLQTDKMIVTVGQATFNAVIFVDITIILWSFYAFFMIIGLSKDLIGDDMAASFKETAKAFLSLNFIMMAILGLLFAYYAYPTRWPYSLSLFAILAGYVALLKLNEVRKRSAKISVMESLKGLLSSVLILTLFFSFMIVMFGNSESLIVPFFVPGFVAALLLVILKERRRRSKSAS
jgi:signal transduction histidine kinase